MKPVRVLALVLGLTVALGLCILGSAWSLGFFDEEAVRKATDPHFILLGNELAPDGNARILIYQYDTGAFGYSRAWWAITPESFTDLNLVKFELPDGYMAEGWSPDGDLLISKWTPYYFTEGQMREIEFNTGDRLHERRIRIVERNVSK